MSLTQKKPSGDSSEKKYNLLHFCGISVLIELIISGKAKLSMASIALMVPPHFLTQMNDCDFMPQNISPALSAMLLLSITFSFY